MLFLFVLGMMLGAAVIILYEQWRSNAFGVALHDWTDVPHLPPPSLVRPGGVPSTRPVKVPADEERAAA